MTLTELKYIVALARERHFGRAAEACFVSQPTLSVAVKKLEDELELKIFERNANDVAVTPLGEEIVRQAQSVLEHAERFGLSQLHQLRGRVGRGAAASACVLLFSTGDAPRLGETARERLKAMVQTNDGFEIARRDLEIRGPGEFLGARQSGDALLRFADLATDTALLEWARATAPVMLE